MNPSSADAKRMLPAPASSPQSTSTNPLDAAYQETVTPTSRTGSLRARRFPLARLTPSDESPHYDHSRGESGSGASAKSTTSAGFQRLSSGQELGGALHFAPAHPLHQHEDAIIAFMRHRSSDSVVDFPSNVSPVSPSPMLGLTYGTSRDSVLFQDLHSLRHHHRRHHRMDPTEEREQQHPRQDSLSGGVTVIYPQASALADMGAAWEHDLPHPHGLSGTDQAANADRVQVRVEGYYESNIAGLLIPNDLPPSTLLYVLTASDGRDLMFKVIQYSLQLIICFLKTPSLFSPEVQALTGPTAERLFRNYNTIRHGRSLFKMGRGLLNLITVQTVCERVWARYESGIARATCAVLLPVVNRVEKLLQDAGVPPFWSRFLSRRLLRWGQVAQLSSGQGYVEETTKEEEEYPRWHLQRRMGAHPPPHGTLIADDMYTHVSAAEKVGLSALITGGATVKKSGKDSATTSIPVKTNGGGSSSFGAAGWGSMSPSQPAVFPRNTKNGSRADTPADISPQLSQTSASLYGRAQPPRTPTYIAGDTTQDAAAATVSTQNDVGQPQTRNSKAAAESAPVDTERCRTLLRPLIPHNEVSSAGSLEREMPWSGVAGGAGSASGDGPLSVPGSWFMATAPTVPPSHSDAVTSHLAPLPYPELDSLSEMKITAASSTAAPPSIRTTTTSGEREGDVLGDEEGNGAPAARLPTDCCALLGPATAVAASPNSHSDTRLSLAPADGNESEVSILSSRSSSFHVRAGGPVGGVFTSCSKELQPASAALPARWRKGPLQFNPFFMALLGIRNLAAACRRFLRDATLVSTERFGTFTFIEVHRRTITHILNRCWLLVSIIDLLMNTVRLLQPGWVKYATARQNIHCRCGCQGDNDPADMVWRTHGFIARRKTDLFFPPLDLDCGAPFVSSIAYVEAANPARMMPACSRCGYLYREIPADPSSPSSGDDTAVDQDDAEVEQGVGREAEEGLGAAVPKDASFGYRTASTAAAARSAESYRGGGSSQAKGSTRATTPEREKPLWVQAYEEEMAQQRSSTDRRTTLKPSGEVKRGAAEASSALLPTPPDGTDAKDGAVAESVPLHAVGPCRGGGAANAGLAASTTGILFVPWLMRQFFDYVWLLRVHPNLTSTVLLQMRYIAELYLSYKYCFGNFETFRGDAPLHAILNPYGAAAGIVSAAVGLLRVVEAAPSS